MHFCPLLISSKLGNSHHSNLKPAAPETAPNTQDSLFNWMFSISAILLSHVVSVASVIRCVSDMAALPLVVYEYVSTWSAVLFKFCIYCMKRQHQGQTQIAVFHRGRLKNTNFSLWHRSGETNHGRRRDKDQHAGQRYFTFSARWLW